MANAQHIQAISGLRALSVLAVLAYHVHPGVLPGGFVGVDFFFVISGFVVSMTMSQYAGDSLPAFTSGFYRRRIARVMPALLVFTSVALLATNVLMPKSFLLSMSNKTGIFGYLGLSNIFLWRSAGDYFAPGTEWNFFTHTWSLAVEEQFYLIYPIAAYFIIASRTWRQRRNIAMAVLCVAAALSLAASAWLTSGDKTLAFYAIFSRFWEMAIGALLFHLRPAGHRAQEGLAWLAFNGALLVGALLAADRLAFPFPGAVPAVVSAALLIHTAYNFPESATSRWLSVRPLVYIGSISYSLYLWHWLYVVGARWTVGLENPVIMVMVVVASILSAMASYHWVEVPCRQRIATLGLPGSRFFLATALVLAGSLSLGYVFTTQLNSIKLSVTRDYNAWYPYLEAGEVRIPGRCDISVANKPVTFGFQSTLVPVACDRVPGGTVVVFGDSHAGAYSRMLYQVASLDNRRVLVYELRDCAPFRFVDLGTIDSPACLAFMAQVLNQLAAELKEGDHLFLPALRVRRYRDIGEMRIEETAQVVRGEAQKKPDPQWLAERLTPLRPLIQKGVQVILEYPKPVFRSAPLLCVDGYMSGKPYCAQPRVVPIDEFLARSRMGRDLVDEAARQLGNVRVWNPAAVLCGSTNCDSMRDGKPLFFDGDHLSGYGNDLLLPSFRALLSSELAVKDSSDR